MDEKVMVNDVLYGIKSNLLRYQMIINEIENITLRQTIQTIRNSDESFQYELFKIAQVKGYYLPSIKANNLDIDEVKNQIM